MKIEIIPPASQPPIDRAYVISMVINSFKGRKDVEVHLFRPAQEDPDSTDYDWKTLIDDHHHPDVPRDEETTRRFILEAFTEEERDTVVEYLKERYKDRVSSITSCTVEFPVPIGLPALSSMPEGKTIGFIRFDRIPNYPLDFPMHGLYDLAQHEPLVMEE